jgi:hypothetical protein
MPLTGKSPVLVAAVAAGYAVTAGVYWFVNRHGSGGPSEAEPGTSSPSSAAQASSS